MTFEEVLWASSVPFHAPAKVGKVHLREPGAARTLCGIKVGRPSRQFVVGKADERCTRCEKKEHILNEPGDNSWHPQGLDVPGRSRDGPPSAAPWDNE